MSSVQIRKIQIEKTPRHISYKKTEDNIISDVSLTANLLIDSAYLDSNSWNKLNVSNYKKNAIQNPFKSGTDSLYILMNDVGGLESVEYPITANEYYNISCYFKWKTGPAYVGIRIESTTIFDGIGDKRHIVFNPRTGTLIEKSDDIRSFQITDVENGWYRLSAVIKPQNYGNTKITFYSQYPLTGMFLYGPQLTNSEVLYTYIPTSSYIRSSQLNSNLVKWSDDYDKLNWTKSNSEVTGNIDIVGDEILDSWVNIPLNRWADVPLDATRDNKLLIGLDTHFIDDVSVPGVPSTINLNEILIYDDFNVLSYEKRKYRITNVYSDTALRLEEEYYYPTLTSGKYKISKNRFSEKNVDFDMNYYSFIAGTIRIVNNQIFGNDTLFTEQCQAGDYITVAFLDLLTFLDDGDLNAVKASATEYFKIGSKDATAFKFKIQSITDDETLTLVGNTKLFMDIGEYITYGIESVLDQ